MFSVSLAHHETEARTEFQMELSDFTKDGPFWLHFVRSTDTITELKKPSANHHRYRPNRQP